jgi:hypothetical protein
MHDLDGGNLELAGEIFGGLAPGTLSSHPAGAPAAPGGGLSEMQELELASELLAVRDEAELEQFISGLASRGYGFGGQGYGHSHRRRLRGIMRHPIQRFYRQHRRPRHQRYQSGLLVPMGVGDGPDPSDLAPDAPAPVIAAPIEAPIVAPVEQPEMELADACRAVRLATAAARRASALPPSAPAAAGSPIAPSLHGFPAAGVNSAYPTASASGAPYLAASAAAASATRTAPSASGASSVHPAASAAASSAAGGRGERGTWTRRGRHIVLSGA